MRVSGPMAEWLRRGLQILARRFDSGSGLHAHTEIRLLVSTFHLLELLAARFMDETLNIQRQAG